MSKDVARLLLELAIELRLRVRVQLHRMSPQEFPLTEMHYRDLASGELLTISLPDA
jgi:predicted ATP-dependent Lon-type protease